MTIDPRIDLLDTAWRREHLAELLNYPIGADRILTVGRRYPVEIETLRHHRFPLLVIFDSAAIRAARACAADGSRVLLTIEGSDDGRSQIVTKVERV